MLVILIEPEWAIYDFVSGDIIYFQNEINYNWDILETRQPALFSPSILHSHQFQNMSKNQRVVES